jgi:hypothetical protein
MRRRIASINDAPIVESERKYHWPLGRCPDEHPDLTTLWVLAQGRGKRPSHKGQDRVGSFS